VVEFLADLDDGAKCWLLFSEQNAGDCRVVFVETLLLIVLSLN
jgi:hypothetical protein